MGLGLGVGLGVGLGLLRKRAWLDLVLGLG